jgi:hypothetical protein
MAGCTVTYSAVPALYHCGPSAAECVNPQTSPITVILSKPVYQLTVYSGGRLSCDGTYGSVVVDNSKGAHVEQRDFVLSDTTDCGYDRVTNGGVDTLRFPGAIARFTINPAQPWTYIVHDTTPEPDTLTAYVDLSYAFNFYERRQPSVDSCLTGDEWLDQRAMRDMLKAAWDSSNATDLPVNRRETRGWVFEDSTGNLVYGVYPYRTPGIPPDTLVDGPCRSVGLPPDPEPGIRVARGHTHVFAPVDTIFPPVCGVKVLSGVNMRFGGASKFDIDQVRLDSIPGYILERDTIRVIPVGTDTVNARSNVKRYPRVDPVTGCRRV